MKFSQCMLAGLCLAMMVIIPAAANEPGKILYYRNPMGLPDVSKTPKKDAMGMDYIPVYESEDVGGAVQISLDRVQRSGVRTEVAKMQRVARVVRVPGIAKPDERTLHIVSLRSDGFIEKLYVNESGAHITAGQPLFRVYSPQAVSAQVDFRNAGVAGRGPHDDAAAVQRLKNLDVPQAVIEQMRDGGQPILSFDWPAPASGYVMEKNVIEGQMAKAGEPLFKIAGLDPVWIIADVPEQEFGLVHIGAAARLHFLALPDEVFEGRVTFILHELDARTRTAKVRIELPNPGHVISHEMFADVEIDAGSGDTDRLVVPASAVIDSGNRQVVIVDKGKGLFEPRAVKLGMRGGGVVEIRDGLKAGESIVVAANFLIDAESNLKAALHAFTAGSKQPDKSEGKP